MGRSILKYIAIIALGLGVFLAAKYLDSNPRNVVQETVPVQTHVWQETVEEESVPETTAPEQEPETTEPEAAEAAAEETAPGASEPEQQRFVLTFAGDCVLGSYPAIADADTSFKAVVGEDYGYPFRNVREWFDNDDFTMINLECVLSDTGFVAAGKYSYRGPEENVKILTESSVECVTIANDHTRDYGAVGYQKTRKVLQDALISDVERDQSSLITLENGLTIGIYGVVHYDIRANKMKQEIAALREKGADVVIFAPHWGFEYSYVPKKEDKQLAYMAIDAGADIVYGTHPRVLQPVEKYGDGIIFYSLGSFCNGTSITPKDLDTALVQVELLRQEDGTIKLGEWSAVPCCVSSGGSQNNFQPTPYEKDSEGFQRVMTKLSGKWPYAHLETT